MRNLIIYIALLFFTITIYAQDVFHVFSKEDLINPGSKYGNGTLQAPWDLQTALDNKDKLVKAGDTIWIHKGIYNGRFSSHLESKDVSNKITVAAYKNERVILNGNVASNKEAVLTIFGANVIYKNFEITCLGEMPRKVTEEHFRQVSGINHISGEDCMFINLRIYNTTGFGFGSWKHAGASVIEECIIYNNGSIAKNGKGIGEGIYTQNKSDKTRIIKNNIVFNNYYKAIEVWSANKHADYEYVKHFTIDNNILFNSGLPAGFSYDNLIVASNDRDGINIVKDILVTNNVMYHNTNINKREINGNAPSLTLGYHKNAPVEEVRVKNNIIIGRNNTLRILHAKSLEFKNNLVYSGYIHLDPSYNTQQNLWNFTNNSYYTKRPGAFRFHRDATYEIKDWQRKITTDTTSKWDHIKNFEAKNVLNLFRSNYNKNQFRVTVFQKEGKAVIVDFSDYNDIQQGRAYKVLDIETRAVIDQGIIGEAKEIKVEIGTFNKTNANFGVFFIEFEDVKLTKARKTIFGKFFEWLGF